jgi:polysaccharide pyruvyl transferase WcaK-like protein
MLYGIGAGPFLTEKGKKETKYYIDNFVDEITVRDKESFRQLKEIVEVTQNIKIKIDPVAVMNVSKYIKDIQDDNSITLIFTEYFNSDYFEEKHRYKWELLFEAFCSQINAVVDSGFIPKLVFFQKNIEENLANKFLEIFGNRIQIEFPNDYKEAIIILNRSKAIISFRLHGNILAYALKKEFLPIIYHHKTDGFLEHIEYKYQDCILEVGDEQNWKDKEIIPQDWYVKTKIFLKGISE